jgi:isopentenyl diphosphate isomerase/L-lactate dehydrogenase-like FMN-dependent dehydrogenase
VKTADLQTIGQIEDAGRTAMSESARTYIDAAAGEGVTALRNRAAWRGLALVPSVLRDVSRVDTATTFLGLDLALPVMCAPVGSLTQFHPDGAAASATGAAKAGTISFVATRSSPAFPEVQRRSGIRNVFQLYVAGDDAWLDALLARLQEAGAAGICLTVTNPVSGRRDRLLETGLDWRRAQEGLVPPNLEGLGRDRSRQEAFTWAHLERLASRTTLPVIVKGVVTAADARRAVDAGARAISVSNHGGYVLDHALSPIEVLEEVVAEVAGQVEVLLDSGVRRGTDVCKALALGARAVLVGRLQCWALAIDGADGVARMMEILRTEIENTMALLGARAVGELSPRNVRPAVPVPL